MGIHEVLSIVASLFNVASMATYFYQLRKRQSIPNPATWLIWLAFTLVNLLTYLAVTNNNFWISSLSIVNTIGTLLLFLYALGKGKFAKVGITEITSLILALVIGIYWKVSDNAIIANIALQIVLVISYYPTYIGLMYGTLKEKWLSWSFSTVGYMILSIAVLLNLETVGRAALVFPLMNVILNAIVTWMAVNQQKRYSTAT